MDSKEHRNAINAKGELMKVIDLPQGSSEWLAWRKSRLTATDIPVILGSNSWKTKLELWEEKLDIRPGPELSLIMARGQRLEPEARELACQIIDINFEPVVVESTKHPWLAASLDGMGIGKNQYILEIKCPNPSTHDNARDNRIPEYYRDQIQTQLLVSEAEICYYFSYRPEHLGEKYAIVEVYPNVERQAEIIEKGYEFYMQMCNFEAPVEWKLKERGNAT